VDKSFASDTSHIGSRHTPASACIKRLDGLEISFYGLSHCGAKLVICLLGGVEWWNFVWKLQAESSIVLMHLTSCRACKWLLGIGLVFSVGVS
jgi:hypothetical protein